MQVAALVAIIKAARQMSLMDSIDQLPAPGGGLAIPVAMLREAAGHRSEALRVDAMQLACVHPRTTAMPGVCCTSSHLPVALQHASSQLIVAYWRQRLP